MKTTSSKPAKITESNDAADQLAIFLDMIGHDWSKGNGAIKSDRKAEVVNH